MDYVEQVARKWSGWRDGEPVPETILRDARDWLEAISATGCKVMAPEMTNKMTEASMHKWCVAGAENGARKTFGAMFDAAPSYPGAPDAYRTCAKVRMRLSVCVRAGGS